MKFTIVFALGILVGSLASYFLTSNYYEQGILVILETSTENKIELGRTITKLLEEEDISGLRVHFQMLDEIWNEDLAQYSAHSRH